MRNTRLTKLAAFSAVAAISVAACGSDDDASSDTEAPADTEASVETEAPADTEPATDAVGLGLVCPDPLVIQTDWFPEAEHGAMYQMVGANPTIDAENKVVSGPLVTTGDVEAGVDIEIRTGGPAVGFQQVVSLMAQEDAITFGYVATDEAIENYPDNPTTAFVAPLEINPQIIMWDPATYPDVETIADLATAKDGDGVTIRYFETGAYMQFLLADGQVTDDQLDGSYDGGPSVFIAENGAIAQQGFASAEPYNYENVFEDWGKPVDFQLIHDAGWQTYAAPLAVLDSKKDDLADCMAAFAPIVQQATIDYINDPVETNELIVQAVNEYNDFWTYDMALGAASVQLQLDLGLVGNGPDAILGNFDEDRLTRFIEIALPVFGVEGLTPADLMTNEYIDEAIGFEVPEEPEAPATTEAPVATDAPVDTEAPADAPSEEFVGIVQSNPETYTTYVAALETFGDEALDFIDAPHTAPSATPLRASADTLIAEFPADTTEADSAMLNKVLVGMNAALQKSEDGDAPGAVNDLLALQADATIVGGLINDALGAA